MKFLTTLLLLLIGTVITAQDRIYVHTATVSNTSGNVTYIDHPDLNGNPNAGLVFVHTYNPGGGSGTYNNKVTGLWYNGGNSRWAIYNEDASALTIGSSYNVYIANSSNVITHVASVANQGSAPSLTVIDDVNFNNQNPGPYAVMSNYFNPNSVYNNQNYGFYYETSISRREIYEEGLNPIPNNAAFKILVNGSGNGVQRFTHQSAAGNISGNYTILDHPALNNNPNATFVYSHYYGVNGASSNVYLNKTTGVWYTGTRWAIYNEDLSTMPSGVAFDVIIAPNDNLTYVPDDNFEAYLEANGMGNGIANDNYVLTANINTVTYLIVSGQNISDLTGIEDFVSLTNLYCDNNQLTSLDVSQNLNLSELRCFNNQLTNLNITQNAALTILRCSNNSLTNLDVTQNTLLTEINCTSNQLSNLDVTQNSSLDTLGCSENLLTNLDVSQNTVLTFLGCGDNLLNGLDVSQNLLLDALYFYNNQITNIDLTSNTSLVILSGFNNQLTSIDVSQNTLLERFFFNNNLLERVNLKNGNNTNIPGFYYNTSANPNLICIEVDNAAYSTTNWTNIDPASSFSENCHYFETYVPDDIFEQRLIDLGYDTVLDDYVLTANINTVTNLDVFGGITDLTGIEDFTALEVLNCSLNNLTSLDLSSNTALLSLNCNYNQLTNLNVSQNTALTSLSCTLNNLSSLDVTQNIALTSLYCMNNDITSLDVTQNTNLLTLYCGDNQLSNLDVSQNLALENLICQVNPITSLDVSQNTALVSLDCLGTQITSLDLTLNTALTSLECSSNQLNLLNLKNGNNVNITYFSAVNNPNLYCIEVDNAAYSNANWLGGIDPPSTFSEDCHYDETYVPDDNFEAFLEANFMGNGIPNDDYVLTANINGVTSLNISSLNISDATGIEDFTALQTLYCDFNNLTNLDVSQNSALTYLDCSDNQLSVLDVSQNLSLASLFCNFNQLAFLNLGANTNLTRLDCDNNLLEGIDVSYSTSLNRLNCGNNLMTALNVSLNSLLTRIEAYNNNISSLDLSQNTALTYINCRTNQLTNLNVKNGNNTNVTYFNSDTNPNLFCIEVDNAIYSTTNWTIIDPNSSFSEDCGTKIWESGAWTNGSPTISDDAIIRDDYSTSLQGNIDSNTLIIDLGFTLTIGSGNYLRVNNNLTINGNLTIEHEGSFVQINNAASVTNNGNIQVQKLMDSFNEGTDFAILGSPMTGETRDGVYNQNNVTMNHLTNNFVPNNDVAIADPLAENFADDDGNNWQFFTGSEAIVPGVGYLVGGITGGGNFTSIYTQGTLNNGVINFNTNYNGTQNASPNVMSNPYASAIDTDVFINNNSIVDAVYFWEHLTPPSSSYPGYRSENWDMGDISMYNLSGGIAAANGGVAPSQYIPSGQGFAIKANALGTVTFDNSLRVTSPNTGYRNPETTNRMYVNISNETYGLKSSTLTAFTPEATDGIDASYDAKRLATPVSIYSTVEDQELAIQGRSAFNEDQVIPLGFRTQVEELQEYTISLGLIEGTEITNATVYLLDNLLQIETNLSETNYSFTSEDGNFSNRFLIYFRQETLGDNGFEKNLVTLYPNPTQDKITISSYNSEIKSFTIFDLQGRKIVSKSVNNFQTTFSISSFNNAIYLISIKTEKGTVTKRIIKK